jgi:flavin reductase (DIM6/NTAB) family NADH-FMN oxidoreductase RutF
MRKVIRNNPVAPIINFLPIEEVKNCFQVIKRKLLNKIWYYKNTAGKGKLVIYFKTLASRFYCTTLQVNYCKLKHYDLLEIQSWERFYRGNFINSLSGFKSVSLIGTCNVERQSNLAIFSNIVHIGADPALIGFINRPLAAASHTTANIEATQDYTINHIQESFVKKAHQTSAKYAVDINEFKAVGLTEIYKGNCKAPFVAESSIQYSMKLVEIIPIKHNGTFLVIGAVQDVYLQQEIVEPDGFIAIEKAGSITSVGIDGYYKTNPIARFDYAKP